MYNRRSKNEIERNIMATIGTLVNEVGFSRITLVGIAERSKTSVNVLYKNYGNLDSLLNLFAKNYAYWFLDAFSSAIKSKDKGDKYFIKTLAKQLTESIYNDKVIEQLLRWEVSENSITPLQTLSSAEYFYKTIFYNLHDAKMVSNSNVKLALLVGGIYYIILIKDKSSFWATNFNSNEGKKKLEETIEEIIEQLFHVEEPIRSTLEIARNMKNKGLDINTISECTGLDLEQISNF